MDRKAVKRLCAVLCAAFLVVAAVVVLSGASGEETAPFVSLFSDEAEAPLSVLAIGSVGTDTVAVFSGNDSAVLLRCDLEGVQARADLPVPLDWAAVVDGALLLKSDETIMVYDPVSLRELSQKELPWPSDDVLACSVDQHGVMYAVLSQSRNCLQIRLPDGTEAVETLPGEIEEIFPCPQGVWVWVEGDLRMVSGAETRAFSWPCAPLAVFDETRFLDRDGLFCTCEDGEILSLFRLEHALYEGPLSCVDGEGCLLTADGAAVLRFGRDGKLTGRRELAAVPDAVTENGAILRKDGAFCFSPVSFVPQVNGTPEPTPDASDEPDEPPEIRLEDGYILLSCGVTVQEIREMIKPETAEIRDRAGRLLTGGRLATGITVNDWIVVIAGDVNGSGTITGSDLHEAIVLYMEEQRDDTPQLRAADLNDDGILDTHDLLLLSQLVEEMEK